MMLSKKSRQAHIIEIVRRRSPSSQRQLRALLSKHGIRTTQPTLSRDVRELGLVKLRGVYQSAAARSDGVSSENLRRSISQLVVDSGLSGNILMLRTTPGNAHSLGVVLDAAGWPEVLGTVAGDDTVFVLLRSQRMGKKALRRVKEYTV